MLANRNRWAVITGKNNHRFYRIWELNKKKVTPTETSEVRVSCGVNTSGLMSYKRTTRLGGCGGGGDEQLGISSSRSTGQNVIMAAGLVLSVGPGKKINTIRVAFYYRLVINISFRRHDGRHIGTFRHWRAIFCFEEGHINIDNPWKLRCGNSERHSTGNKCYTISSKCLHWVLNNLII